MINSFWDESNSGSTKRATKAETGTTPWIAKDDEEMLCKKNKPRITLGLHRWCIWWGVLDLTFTVLCNILQGICKEQPKETIKQYCKLWIISMQKKRQIFLEQKEGCDRKMQSFIQN